jgi:hypothetical protein
MHARSRAVPMPLVPDSGTVMPGPSFMNRSSSTMGFEVPVAIRDCPNGVSAEVNARSKASLSGWSPVARGGVTTRARRAPSESPAGAPRRMSMPRGLAISSRMTSCTDFAVTRRISSPSIQPQVKAW